MTFIKMWFGFIIVTCAWIWNSKKNYYLMELFWDYLFFHSSGNLVCSAYLCAKCKVLFDTITIYDEHLENCKNNPENYNFDEVLEKLRFVCMHFSNSFRFKNQI